MAPQPAPKQTYKSTGPRTESGKAASSQNALRHGLASGTILIPGEDPEELKALELALLEQYKPASAIEELLLQDMVNHHWLKDRALRLQGEALALAQLGELPATFSVLLRYQTTNERAFHKALATLQAVQKEARTVEQQFVSQSLHSQFVDKLFAPLPSLAGRPSLEELEEKYRQKETF
jgi:hypothetical protein